MIYKREELDEISLKMMKDGETVKIKIRISGGGVQKLSDVDRQMRDGDILFRRLEKKREMREKKAAKEVNKANAVVSEKVMLAQLSKKKALDKPLRDTAKRFFETTKKTKIWQGVVKEVLHRLLGV